MTTIDEKKQAESVGGGEEEPSDTGSEMHQKGEEEDEPSEEHQKYFAPDPQEDVDFSSLPWNLNVPEHHSYMHLTTTTGNWSKYEENPSLLETGLLNPYDQSRLALAPAATSLNYGTTVWEGMKCYRLEDGKTALIFRPDQNYERMKYGAEQLCLPFPSKPLFLRSIQLAVQKNGHLIPPYTDDEYGMKLYIRPILFGSGQQLGLHPSPEVSYVVYVSPTGPYIKGGTAFPGLNLHLELKRCRAARGGVGNVKCSGNYAAVLKPLMDCKKYGFHDNLFLELETYSVNKERYAKAAEEELQAEIEAAAEFKAAAEAKAEAEAKAAAEAKAVVEAEAAAEGEPGDMDGAEAESKVEAQAGGESDDQGEVDAGSHPEEDATAEADEDNILYIQREIDYAEINATALNNAVLQEMSAANVFFVLKTGEIVTPSLERGTVLPGVTRDSILQLAELYKDDLMESMVASICDAAAAEGEEDVLDSLDDITITVSSRDVTVGEVYEHAIEAFCTGTAAEVVPIARLATAPDLSDDGIAFEKVFAHGQTLPGGPVTQSLHNLLRAAMHGKLQHPVLLRDQWLKDTFDSPEGFCLDPDDHPPHEEEDPEFDEPEEAGGDHEGDEGADGEQQQPEEEEPF